MNVLKREIELDIAMNAGALISRGVIEIEDSRAFIHSDIPDMAEMFLGLYGKDEDYIEQVDRFAEIQLLSRYRAADYYEEDQS